MELTDGTIALRPVTREDSEAAHAAVLASFPDLTPWMPWAHPGYSFQDSVAWSVRCAEQWERGERHRAFYIWDATSGSFLGSIDLRVDDDQVEAEIGYWVATGSRNRGVCTAAVGLLARWGFETFQLSRIRIRVDPANAVSRRVAAKAGGVEEPELHRHVHDDGSSHELVTYILARP